MSGPITNINRVLPGLIEQLSGQQSAKAPKDNVTDGKFSDMVTDLINSVNQLQSEAGQAQEAFLAGEPVELHQVMIKAEQAGISLDLLLDIRNKLLSAYQEIMRLPI